MVTRVGVGPNPVEEETWIQIHIEGRSYEDTGRG